MSKLMLSCYRVSYCVVINRRFGDTRWLLIGDTLPRFGGMGFCLCLPPVALGDRWTVPFTTRVLFCTPFALLLLGTF